MNEHIRIAVVDDHPLMREGIVLTLGREPGFDLVASGGSADDAVRIAVEACPDVMLLDVKMPGGGVEAAREIAAIRPRILILFLTVSERREHVTAALSVGARGYILKGIGGPDLVKTIRNVYSGETYITPEFAAKLLAFRHDLESDEVHKFDSGHGLTTREAEILQALSLGMTNKQIARKLDLSEKTVKHYMTGILRKLGVHNRVEAVVVSRRLNCELSE